jgi:hypothetical protein
MLRPHPRVIGGHHDQLIPRPTVVLVHGAFADGSSCTGVIERLNTRGVQVTAVANPLRGISIDSAYVAGVFEQRPGPVVAVGRWYGGAGTANAAARAENVAGLVFTTKKQLVR